MSLTVCRRVFARPQKTHSLFLDVDSKIRRGFNVQDDENLFHFATGIPAWVSGDVPGKPPPLIKQLSRCRRRPTQRTSCFSFSDHLQTADKLAPSPEDPNIGAVASPRVAEGGANFYGAHHPFPGGMLIWLYCRKAASSRRIDYCVFCENNNETPRVFRSHMVRSTDQALSNISQTKHREMHINFKSIPIP